MRSSLLLRSAWALYCASCLSAVAPAHSQTTSAALASNPAAPGASTSAATTAQAPLGSAAYTSDPRFVAAIAEGKKLAAGGDLNFAIDAYRKANKIAGGKCMDCLQDAVGLDIKNKDYKAAAKDAAAMVAISVNPSDKSISERQRAQALYLQAGDKPKPEQLQAVHNLLQAALADYPKNVSARFLDGTVLARMGQTDAARRQFETCVDQCPATDPYLVRARHFTANPALSYAKMAPAFTVTALDGSKFTLDEMGGRVVLIDFWATWCGPCNRELPHIKKIAKEFAGQPLVIISISWDDDAAKWKAFIAKNEMTWVQYRDADHELTKAFGIDAIPHFFTIDSSGVLTSEMLGEGSDVEGKLKKLIAKAGEAQPATVASASHAAE
jgi:thiol-disulfide isomerase/thioredoxin